MTKKRQNKKKKIKLRLPKPKALSKKKILTKSKKLLRVPTGIEGLDSIIQGGFEQGGVHLVAGGAGAGKSIFSMQFIMNGILKYNEPGIYVSFEEKKEPFFKHMQKFGWNLPKLEAQGKFAFIEYSPEQVKNMLEEGGGLIDSLLLKIGAKRLVMDSITAFALLFPDKLLRKQSILGLFDLIRKWDVTALLTAEFEPSLETPSTKSILFEVDSIILLYYLRKGDLRKRALEVLKMRGTEHAKKILPIRISKKGVVVYPNERVF